MARQKSGKHSSGAAAAPAESDTPVERLMRSVQYFFPGEQSADRRSVYRENPSDAEDFYRER